MLEGIKEILEYSPGTGRFTCKKNYYTWKVGATVGARVDGYIYIGFGGKLYPAHRLAIWFMTGDYYTGDIDHVNMKRDDNRWFNLRKCSRAENMKNTTAHCDSKTGFKGVTFRQDINKYSVRITVDGKYKSFGCFSSLSEAVDVANEARKKHHGEFYNNNNRDSHESSD